MVDQKAGLLALTLAACWAVLTDSLWAASKVAPSVASKAGLTAVLRALMSGYLEAASWAKQTALLRAVSSVVPKAVQLAGCSAAHWDVRWV